MFYLTLDQYTLSCNPAALPSLYSDYVERARLVEEFDLEKAEAICFLAVGLAVEWPFLVVTQGYDPSGGFHPGALLVPETGVLFIGAGERILAYALEPPSRLWEDRADVGFWGWARHGDTVIMSAELELAAWDIRGWKLWSTFVEPPWTYTTSGNLIHLDVMGKRTAFPITTGPPHPDD